MIVRLILTSTLALSGLFGFAQSIIQEQSVVNFKIGNLMVNTVEGTFKGMEGVVQFNPDDLASAFFNVCIDASTVSTGNKKRDSHLRTEDFFHVDQHPEICFESQQVKSTAAGYVAVGTLTLLGNSKTVEITFNYGSERFEGQFTINRFDFNLGEGTSTFTVGDEVEIKVICVLK